MPITIRHDAAAVVPPSNASTRKYGQQLVMQQQQQKYAAQQAGYDRLFQLGRDQQDRQNQFVRDVRQATIQERRDRAQNDFLTGRDKAQFDQQQQLREEQRQQAFMDEARKQQTGIIMSDIQNGEYDTITAKRLQQNIIAESEALGSKDYDATQRAEALKKIREERALLTTNRLQKPPPPTAQEQFDKSIVTGPDGAQYRQNAKGDFEPLPQQPKRPSTSQEAFAADPKLRDKYMADAVAIVTKTYDEELGGTVEKPLTRERRKEAAALAHKLWEEDNLPTAAPELAGEPPASPPASRSILESTAQQPDPGMPPAPPARSPIAAPPLPGAAPASPPSAQSQSIVEAPINDPRAAAALHPEMTKQGYQLVTPPAESGRNPYYYKDTTKPIPSGLGQGAASPATPAVPNQTAPPPVSPKRQVKVNGKPLVVTPGTLTPQETEARAKIMEMSQEDRIKTLMPYDPTGELKGRTLEQLLDDPQSKAQYDELTKQGLTTGNYREDMLNHLDEMLQHNVLNGAGQTPPEAYVGMRADEITDPKAKAIVDKMPRPKTPEDMRTISGPYFVDPDGIIRGTRR